MRSAATLTACFVVLLGSGVVGAQPFQASPSISVPRLINVTGVFTPADGRPPGREVVTLAIYADEAGGEPLWDETQTIDVDPLGRYTLLLGATQADGVPLEVFASGEARWLGIAWARPGEVAGARLRLTSVPYALRAADADTLGGKPASAYVVAPTGGSDGTTRTAADGSVSLQAVLPGTTNFLAKYVNGVDVGTSAVYESNGLVGINTTTPGDVLHAAFTNPSGTMTGIAVQNFANTATSYSGMLFYDHTGALGQFQGFNNVTKEYRINNVAPGGSINFMTGSTSRFLVNNSGNIGIGTTSPAAALEVSRNTPTSIFSSSYGSGSPFTFYPFGPSFEGRRARGTVAAPAAVMAGDRLATFIGSGYDSAAWGPGAQISMVAAENWSSSGGVPFRHRGTHIHFSTVSRFDVLGNLNTRMVIADTGGVSMPAAFLSVSNDGYLGGALLPPKPQISVIDSNGDSEDVLGGPAFVASKQTFDVPVLNGDTLVSISGAGSSGGGADWVRSGTVEVGGLGGGAAEIALRAAQDWNEFSQGTEMRFRTTPNGTTVPSERMIIDGVGNVGIGTTTPLDKLQVVGDIRVGTVGTNGCLRRFDGGSIIGTCASDRRFKKDITPFAPMLRSVSALQPVHYSWRATEFPDRHFGDSRAYGLIAQDVEQILPELVVTQDDGYKAIDYTKLPLLTIQAVKELKAENDALKDRLAELETLRQRVTELERLVNELQMINARR